jgi:ubiquitin C-terminal hydrolase
MPPPGLVNNGKNVCFLNALLQSLATFPVLFSTEIGDILHAIAKNYAKTKVLDINMKFHTNICSELKKSSQKSEKLRHVEFCSFKSADSFDFFNVMVEKYPQFASQFAFQGYENNGGNEIELDLHGLYFQSGGNFLDKLNFQYANVVFKRWPVLLVVQITLGKESTTQLLDKFDIDGNEYKLKAIALHLGIHYVAFAMRRDQWYLFDDRQVRLIQFDSILRALKHRSYILFYVRSSPLVDFFQSNGDLTKFLQ